MKLKIVEIVAVILIIFQALVGIFIFPNLDNPDSLFHYQVITNQDGEIDHNEKSLYYDFMSFFYEELSIPKVEIETNVNFDQLSFEPLIQYGYGNNLGVMFIQLIHLVGVLIAVLLFYITISVIKLTINEKRLFSRAYLIYMMWPSISLGYISISPDYVNYLFAPFLVIFLYKRKYIIVILLEILIFTLIDEGAITSLYFIGMYILISLFYKKKITFKAMLVCTFFTAITTLILVKNISILGNHSVIQFITFINNEYGFLPTKFLNLFLSFVSFPGSGSFYTFPLIYLFVLLFVGVGIFNVFKMKEEALILPSLPRILTAALIATITLIIIFPPFSHIRFYTFLVYIVILVLMSTISSGKLIKNDYLFFYFSLLIAIHNIFLIAFIGYWTFN